MHEVVVTAVRAAVRAATTIFSSSSQNFVFFIAAGFNFHFSLRRSIFHFSLSEAFFTFHFSLFT